MYIVPKRVVYCIYNLWKCIATNIHYGMSISNIWELLIMLTKTWNIWYNINRNTASLKSFSLQSFVVDEQWPDTDIFWSIHFLNRSSISFYPLALQWKAFDKPWWMCLIRIGRSSVCLSSKQIWSKRGLRSKWLRYQFLFPSDLQS